MFLAGFLAAYAAVVELQVGPVSAILGFYLLVQCIRRERRLDDLALFGVGAAIPTLILLGYNQLAFGSPWEMGYFHHATREFAEVHNAENPLGLAFPESFWGRLGRLLWGRYRGLTFYAPILLLTVPGWIVLLARRCCERGVLSRFSWCVAVLLVNVFYPEWTGGWSTGPRLLVPLLAVRGASHRRLARGRVAALEGRDAGSRWRWLLAGGVEMLLFQGVGGRIPHDIADPLVRGGLAALVGRAAALVAIRTSGSAATSPCSRPRTGLPARARAGRESSSCRSLLFQAAGIIGLWRFGLDDRRQACPEIARCERACHGRNVGIRPGY